MSGLKFKNTKSNPRGRPRRHLISTLGQRSDSVSVKALLGQEFKAPLTIVRVSKKGTNSAQDNKFTITERDNNSRINSDGTPSAVPFPDSVQHIMSGATHDTLELLRNNSDSTNNNTSNRQNSFVDILDYPSLDEMKPLSFESSDLSSEDDIFETSMSPSSTTVINENTVPPHSFGVDLTHLPKVQFVALSDLEKKEKEDSVHKIEKIELDEDNSSEDDSIYQQQQQLQEEQLLIQHYQLLQQQHYPQGIGSGTFIGQTNKDVLRSSRIFNRPENHYLHYIEPSDEELYDSVEYDMDEQDKNWLKLYNKERRKDFLGDVSPYLFECIMDKLEKEWFNLVKNAPTSKKVEDPISFPEDSACAVCNDTEVENSNAIVFCDGCNVAVHQECYGVPYIPEGQWLCRKCMMSPEFPVSCVFCPNEGGAFKQTNTNQWAHLLCAIWIPEVGVGNSVYMEPINMIENIPKSRWKLVCSICRKKQGACIQCDNKQCFSAFHVTCAKAAKLCMKMDTHSSESEEVVLKAYCDKHAPKGYYVETPETKLAKPDVSRRGRRTPGSDGLAKEQSGFETTESKVARAHQHQYSASVPIPSDVMLTKIDSLPCVQFSGIRKRQELVNAIAHYWSLKRESRRGAPLLKRLHLEPWTATTKFNGDEKDQIIRKSIITQLRTDLEKVRILSEQVQKRERQKLERIKKQKSYLEMLLFPLDYICQPILSRFIEIDRKNIFLDPNNHSPICLTDIQKKLSQHEYLTLDQFKSDMESIWESCLNAHQKNPRALKTANKLLKASKKLFELMDRRLGCLELREDGTWNEPIDESIFDYHYNSDENEVGLDDQADESMDESESEPDTHEKQEHDRLEFEKLKEEKEEDHRRAVQARIEGKAKAKALRLENESNGIMPEVTKKTRARQSQRQLAAAPKESIQHQTDSSVTNVKNEYTPMHDLTSGTEALTSLNEADLTLSTPIEEGVLDIHQDTNYLNYFYNQPFGELFDKEVSDLRIQQPSIEHSMHTSYPPEIFDEPIIICTNNENELTINNFDQFFQDNREQHMNMTETPYIHHMHINPHDIQQPVNITVPNPTQTSTTNQPRSPKEEKKRKRSTPSGPARRLTRSAGLTASIEELTKKPKISHEARMLYSSYNGVSHLNRHVEVYKENKKKHAPIGWVYIDDIEGEKDNQDDDEDNESSDDDMHDENQENKQKHGRQSRNGIPIPNFQRGEIVWARVDRYPSHPAKFLNYSDEEAGPKLVASRRYAGDVLVEFLKVPEIHRYGWVGRRTICEIGDPDVDKKRLSEALQKRPKRNFFIEESKEGYRCAGSILGLDPEPIIASVFNSFIPKKKKKHSHNKH